MIQLRVPVILAAAACLFAVTPARAAPSLPAGASAFIQKHCIDCHDADQKEGNLDLTSLAFDLDAPKTFDLWVKVHDRVRDGEMPPKKKARPDAAATAAFLQSIAEPMAQADRAREAAEGRAGWRRLNRYEYENALRDLLHVPWLQVKQMLPEDGEAHRFNKSGEALPVSHVHVASYLSAAEYALRSAMATQVARPATTTRRFYAREQRGFANKMIFSQFNRSPERSTFPLLGYEADLDVLNLKAPVTVGESDPVKRELESFGVVASAYEPIEPKFDRFRAPTGGRYRLKLSAYTFWAGPGPEKRWWVPDRTKASKGHRDEPVTLYAVTPPRSLRRLGSVDVFPDPSVQELGEVELLAGETIQVDAARLFRSRPSNWHNPLATREGQPGVAFKWLEVEGPVLDQWPGAGHRLMFGDLPIKDRAGGGVDVISDNPHADAERLLRGFMQAAYRRPVPEAEVQRFLAVIDSGLKAGAPFADAMIAGYSAVLCSPDFTCVEEQPGRLDDDALASRLAFFLWNSPPDAELRSVAARGQLHDPAVLRAQADRMLADPEKSQRFVDAFLDYWLELRKMDATAPDATLYPDYYLDDLLTESAEQETRMFFAELLHGDLPAGNIVSSDFAMLNERLADLYGVPGVRGVKLRRVPLPPDSVRGGLMTQASILKVTANGTTTSPVLRGNWIMSRVLGKPPPPQPPGVGAIEPDIRGATTIRQQLEKHRAQATCAACHTKMDPAGFALENFDVLGGWRDCYRAVGGAGGVPPVEGYGKNGQKFEFHPGPKVDASSTLPDGRAFSDIRGLKKLLLSDQRQIARNLVEQLIAYSTGASVRFGDRDAVEAILDRAEKDGYGVKSLVKEIVCSDVFGMK
jgi:mono/diheme cytochrome c family protein